MMKPAKRAMAKSKTDFDVGDPIIMRGRVKFADDETGRMTVILDGYEIPITTHKRNVEDGMKGPAPKSNDNRE